MERVGVIMDRAPGKEASFGIVSRAVAAEKIDAPLGVGIKRLGSIQRCDWYAQLAGPDVLPLIHLGGVLEAGIPLGIGGDLLSELDLEIDPQVVRRHFKLVI